MLDQRALIDCIIRAAFAADGGADILQPRVGRIPAGRAVVIVSVNRVIAQIDQVILRVAVVQRAGELRHLQAVEPHSAGLGLCGKPAVTAASL